MATYTHYDDTLEDIFKVTENRGKIFVCSNRYTYQKYIIIPKNSLDKLIEKLKYFLFLQLSSYDKICIRWKTEYMHKWSLQHKKEMFASPIKLIHSYKNKMDITLLWKKDIKELLHALKEFKITTYGK